MVLALGIQETCQVPRHAIVQVRMCHVIDVAHYVVEVLLYERLEQSYLFVCNASERGAEGISE